MPTRIALARNSGLVDAMLLSFVALLLRGPTFGLSDLGPDETIFGLIGGEILRGNWPFTTAFDHKPIGLYLHFAAAIALIGESPSAGRTLGWFFVTLSAILVRQFAVQHFFLSRRWSLLFSTTFLLATVGLDGAAALSEHFVNFYALLAAYLLLSTERPLSAWLSGIAAGLALSVNYLAAFVCGGMLVGYLICQPSGEGRRALRRLHAVSVLSLIHI